MSDQQTGEATQSAATGTTTDSTAAAATSATATAESTTTSTTAVTGTAAATVDAAATTAATASSAATTSASDGQQAATSLPAFDDVLRRAIAGTDEKLFKQLQRVTSLASLAQAWQQAGKRISEGGLKQPLPDKATPEQLTAWRKENGIPEKAEDYLANLPEGLVIGETDKPIFESFVKELHAVNADPKAAHAAVAWYNKFQEDQIAQQREADTTYAAGTEDALRAEWGADYRVNQAIRTTFLNRLPEGIKDVFLSSRMPDGRALGDHPDLSKWLVSMERELNPSATLSGGAMGGDIKAIESRKAEIEKLMGNQHSEYWRGPNAAKLQAEFDSILKTQQKLQARAA